MRLVGLVAMCLMLSACMTTGNTASHLDGPMPSDSIQTVASVSIPSQRLHNFAPTDKFLQCVPYAREVSGIQIYGDAWTWWSQAGEKHFRRGQIPEVGAVLTLRKTSRLKLGHVAVVSAILNSRKILVNQANWGSDSRTRGKVHYRQPVVDVSPNNDWSEVRMMNTQGTFGSVYPAHGFIYQPTETADAG
ncbi:CHAP domain-containing protein [Thalassospira sp. MA62]|nr:CHAP domain-containing protein [Thalassospira sp. MA62]